MTTGVDPTTAMHSFQEAILAGDVRLKRCELDRDLYFYGDLPNGSPRFTYVRLDGNVITAFVNLVPADSIDGLTCFQIGCAVPEAYRRKGNAKSAVKSAMIELEHGLSKNGFGPFYVESIVDCENIASQRLSKATISQQSKDGPDCYTGRQCRQYVKKLNVVGVTRAAV